MLSDAGKVVTGSLVLLALLHIGCPIFEKSCSLSDVQGGVASRAILQTPPPWTLGG